MMFCCMLIMIGCSAKNSDILHIKEVIEGPKIDGEYWYEIDSEKYELLKK